MLQEDEQARAPGGDRPQLPRPVVTARSSHCCASVLRTGGLAKLGVVQKYPSAQMVFALYVSAGYCFFSQILRDVRLLCSNTTRVGLGQEYDIIEENGAWCLFFLVSFL